MELHDVAAVLTEDTRGRCGRATVMELVLSASVLRAAARYTRVCQISKTCRPYAVPRKIYTDIWLYTVRFLVVCVVSIYHIAPLFYLGTLLHLKITPPARGTREGPRAACSWALGVCGPDPTAHRHRAPRTRDPAHGQAQR